MKKFQSKIQSIEHDSNKNLVTQTWTNQSKQLNADGFKSEMLELAKVFDQTQPEKVVIDMRNFFFAVVPELQNWVNDNVNSKLAKMENTKTAYIVSSDLFTKVSVEQTLDENAGVDMDKKFFDDYNNAKAWLGI